MDRRKTLAGLSPAQLNARASLAPSRGMGGGGKAGVAAAGGKLPIEKALSRMSLAGPVARRSSAYTTKASGLKSDPRPVSDKGFQATCIRTVIAFLAGHGYEYAITPKARLLGAVCRLCREYHTRATPAMQATVIGPSLHMPVLRCYRWSGVASSLAAVHGALPPPHPRPALVAAGAVQPHHQGLHQRHDVPVPPAGPCIA